MAKLSDPVTMLKGVGEVRAKQLAQLNIFTLRDLICHFPRGYEDRTKLVPIEKLEPDVPACFRAMVMNTPRTSHIRKGLDLTKVQVADSTGRLNVTFFNSRFAAQQLEYGREYIFYGAVSGDFIGYSMTNPVFEAPESQPVTTRRILPIYPLTAGLTNAALLRLVQQALAVCDPPEEILPAEVREKYGISSRVAGYSAVYSSRIFRHSACRAGIFCHPRAEFHGGGGAGEKADDLRGILRILRGTRPDARRPEGKEDGTLHGFRHGALL